MKTIILDSGHGGIVAGKYQTQGKRSPVWSDGSVLYEGECNRQIKWRVMEIFQAQGIPFIDVSPEHTDISLETRVRRANKHGSNSLFLSIHSNAGGGTGSEVFVSKNCSRTSMKMAIAFEACYESVFISEVWRGIKKKDFYVIKNTSMPAILIESFFMDTERECKQYLMNKKGRDMIADWIFRSLHMVL